MTKHEQILDYIKSLKTGTRISVRKIAEKMNVSEGTAYRAIKDAQNTRLVDTIPRVGTVRIQSKANKDIEKLTFSEVLNIVEGSIIAGRTGFHKPVNNFVIGAMTPEAAARYLDDNSLLIVGNREELFSLALEKNCAILITGGFSCSEKIKEEADVMEIPVLNCSYDTFTAATLINKVIYNRMVKKDIILVEDIIVRDIFFLTTDNTIKDWKTLVRKSGHTRFPVVDDNGNLAGMVTTKDINEEKETMSINNVMSSNPITVTLKTSVAYVAHIMVWEGIELIPVVDGRKLVGVVSRQDVIKALQYRKNQPQVGNTQEEFLLKNFHVMDCEHGIILQGKIEPFMLNNLGSGSCGTLVMLISLAASMAVKKKKKVESVIKTLSAHFIKPVQLNDAIKVIVKIIEAGRNSCGLDVFVMHDNSIVMKAIMSASYFRK